MVHCHEQSISVTMTMPSLFVTRKMDCHGGIRLSSFVLGGLIIADKNVGLQCFVGAWTDYQCHSGMISNYIISLD